MLDIMLVVHNADHRLHDPRFELFNGEFVPPTETPSRMDAVLQELSKSGVGTVIDPIDCGLGPLQRVHCPDYLRYLQTAWDEWSALGRQGDVLPFVFVRSGANIPQPLQIDAKAGYFSFDTGAPLCAGTWRAVRSAANCALTAQLHASSRTRSAFALCRPPGHHAGVGTAGGYCYVNNAAVAAQAFIDNGADRIAILDIDYHHGNGTQEIFYRRSDVLFASIHAHPKEEYPYFSGYADEIGEGPGRGFNRNYPLALEAQYERDWQPALGAACRMISRYAPDALVVSLGVDTFQKDPISRFKLVTADYLRVGEAIGALGYVTVFIMEGGYAIDQLGTNVVNVLRGFEQRA